MNPLPHPPPQPVPDGKEAFAGPLEALLELLDNQPERILTVSLGVLTRRYFDWLRNAQRQGMAATMEFVEMAARLILVKSRETLAVAKKWKQDDDDKENPASEDSPRETISDDPNAAERETLRRELEEAKRRYEREQFRAIAGMLRNQELVSSATLARGRDLSTAECTHLRLSDLIVHIREVRRLYARPQESLSLAAETTEAELHAWLLRRVGAQPADFKKLLRRRPSRRERCLLFSALLQTCKTGALTVEQQAAFGRIWVSRRAPSESGSRAQ